jgi:hypothetical protein
MCGRTFCEHCGAEMIHRDNRKPYESASALGQIVHGLKRTFTYGDIDGYIYKRALNLLRFVEHKQPHQTLKGPQDEALSLLDAALACYVDTGALHPESGVYVMRGHLAPATTGYRQCQLDGEQRVSNRRLGSLVLADEDDLYAWLEGDLSPTLPGRVTS